MEASRRKFIRETADQRKCELIQATLTLIGKSGVRAATVRGIAKEAGVTLGLIRHHFSSKEELINAAYQHHMSEMTQLTMGASSSRDMSAAMRLATVVKAGLSPPVVEPEAIALWASFLNQIGEDARMEETHQRTYYEFRDKLESLIGEAIAESNSKIEPKNLRQLAIACNAVIDGLWMEGGALPNEFEPGELASIGLRSVSSIIGIKLYTEEEL